MIDTSTPTGTMPQSSSIHESVINLFNNLEKEQQQQQQTNKPPTTDQNNRSPSNPSISNTQTKSLASLIPKPSSDPNSNATTNTTSNLTTSQPPASSSASTSEQPSLRYWQRLDQLLQEANESSIQLRPSSITKPSHEDKGAFGAVAIALQGLSATLADEKRKTLSTNPAFAAATEQNSVGTIVEYGVSSPHAVWVAQKLACVISSREKPSDEVINNAPLGVAQTCADKCVETVRVRVYEAEMAFLPTHVAAEITTVRKGMKKLRQRIELCMKILCMLEGRSRKFQQNLLEKWIGIFEKNENSVMDEKEKGRVVTIAKNVHEKNKEAKRLKKEKNSEKEAVKNVKTEEQKKKNEIMEKKKRERNAQASFMMRFVKSDKGKSGAMDGNGKEKAKEENTEIIEVPLVVSSRIPQKKYAASVADDMEVMDVSWWLRSEMEYDPTEANHPQIKNVQTPSDACALVLEHLKTCTKRRKTAEQVVSQVLKRFREQRKEHIGDRTPYFCKRRAQVRGQGILGPIKLLQFDEDHRPAFYGTKLLQTSVIKARKPLAKDEKLDYGYDSADEWEEEEEGEDLCDVEIDKEKANEDAELLMLYGSDEEDDDDFLDDDSVDGTEASDEEVDESIPINEDANTKSTEGDVISTQPSINTDAKENAPNSLKRVKKYMDDSRRIKRRKGWPKNNVIIHGGSTANEDTIAELDKCAVTIFDNAPTIEMFNPYVYHLSSIAAEGLHGKQSKTTNRSSRNAMNENARRDLAIAMKQGASSRDKLATEFCEQRKKKGLDLFSKAEVMRVIGEIGIFEKRQGDSRATWYLSNAEEQKLEIRIEQDESMKEDIIKS